MTREEFTGNVLVWHDDEGWGVIDLPALDGTVWVHHISIMASGFRTLGPGQAVAVTVGPGQDGHPYSARTVRVL